MVKIILSGCGGAMGRVISRCAAVRGDCEIVAGIDPAVPADTGYPVFASAIKCVVDADVAIDFSHPSALGPLLDMAEARGLPVVVATTGLDSGKVDRLREAALKIPVFYSANMSLGINLMLELAKTAARVLGSEFDIEIVEKHHNRKLDAPSGTAMMLADGVASALERETEYVYDRHNRREKRAKNEIGLHAIRGGTIVGEHEIIFAGPDEVLTLSHTAASKEVFATGAISAALFLAGKPAGMYSMENLV